MSADILLFDSEPRVLEFGSSLSRMVEECRNLRIIRSIDFYVISAPAITKEGSLIKCLPFYSKCEGRDRSGVVRVETLPSYEIKVPYGLSDIDFEEPARFTKIDPLEKIMDYGMNCSIYLAQETFAGIPDKRLNDDIQANFHLRFNPIENVRKAYSITAKEARKMPSQGEPVLWVA
ncbi:MAG: hypothetical protein ABH824_03760 [Nanoarchaeota archaeon]|nr:hypothetical protein [Nanoarchaeota archaeon]MBU1631860.1 hypothetical protein [Nanoarchaeota archaeon]MBU1875853.1 hypothetical protein [Nanoarchaeota archaeon]